MTSSELARRILAHDARTVGNGTPEAAASVLQQACTRVTDVLRESMGDAGCTALLARAFAHTERAYPPLKDLRRPGDNGVRLDGIAASADKHGIEDVTAAIEALITAVIDILTRLIGEDMTIQLFDYDKYEPPTRGGAGAP
ncbi:MAG TPA: hypothetical protein VFJ20_03715 [Gemmatimonadaceae bacterium]|nr:hypothetical protein [Gemmatimonadaceae bacterium]